MSTLGPLSEKQPYYRQIDGIFPPKKRKYYESDTASEFEPLKIDTFDVDKKPASVI